jgi:hypothetical protein
MMPIKQYIILSAENPFYLEKVISLHLLKQWIPQGGLCIDRDGYCYQAMIKYLCNHHSEKVGDDWVCNKCGEKV